MLHEIVSGHDFNEEMHNAIAIMDSTFEQLGVPQLKGLTHIEFNPRFTRRAGDAKLSRRGMWEGNIWVNKHSGKIRLGTKYFSVASDEDKMQTVVHEACHIANDYMFHTNTQWRNVEYDIKQERATDGHGPGWAKLMGRMGLPANRFHCMNVVQFKTYFHYSCPCGEWKFNFTTQRAGRQINGTNSYCCPKCKAYCSPSRFVKIDGAELTYGKV
jgi:predicted SprT family Zn-dependent metalloprotease